MRLLKSKETESPLVVALDQLGLWRYSVVGCPSTVTSIEGKLAETPMATRDAMKDFVIITDMI